MKADTNLLVTVSDRNNAGRWQVFATNLSERFVFGVRDFADFKSAERHAEALADRLSCRLSVSAGDGAASAEVAMPA